MLFATSRLLVPLFLLGALTSCVSLKTVQDYTKTSLKTVNKFEELNYSFNSHCMDQCVQKAVTQNAINRINTCDCQVYQRADSITMVFYKTINAYFTALGDLAGNDLTTYNFKGLETALKEQYLPVNRGMINITGDQVSSYSKIASLLSRAATETYRKKKLAVFIKEGNEPIKTLLTAFAQILTQHLAAEIPFKQERLHKFYNEIVLDETSSIFERRNATREYYNEMAASNAKKQLIETFAKSLQKVANGHETLTKTKLTPKALQETLTPVSTDIKLLIAEFNKLKNTSDE